MRSNFAGVTEVASLRTDQKEYNKNFEHIFTKDYSVTYQITGYEASNSFILKASSEIEAKRMARERINEIISESGDNASYEILSVSVYQEKLNVPDVKIETVSPTDKITENMRIKELAKNSWRDNSGEQGSEGFPESTSYIYGFMEGYKAAKEGK